MVPGAMLLLPSEDCGGKTRGGIQGETVPPTSLGRETVRDLGETVLQTSLGRETVRHLGPKCLFSGERGAGGISERLRKRLSSQ